MKIIKLSAINSTNSFLKELAQSSALESFTVAVTNQQEKGRGQLDNSWISEPFKNLTTSIFIANIDLEIKNQKYLNFAVSLAIYNLLTRLKIKNISIKWPNDIMAVNKKICGILIENTIKGSTIKNTIIGIGLNVNQEKFPNLLKNVSSLKILSRENFDLETLLLQLIDELKIQMQLLSNKEYTLLETNYLNVLYKKNIPTMFKNSNDVLFIGKIIGISAFGNLLIELEDDSIREFGIKEVSLA